MPFPPLSSSSTIAVIGGDESGARTLLTALASAGTPLAAAEASDADVVVLLHGVRANAAAAAFADLTRLAARAVPPTVLIGVATDSPDGAAFTGVIKTAAAEWGAAWKCIAGSDADTVCGAAGHELARGGTDREVRVGRTRAVRLRVPQSSRRAVRTLAAGTWVVSGGARGVTAECCAALAGAGARRIVLLGRTPLEDEPAFCAGAADEAALKRLLIARADGKADLKTIGTTVAAILAQRDIRRTIAALESAGAEVRYLAVDVADAAAVNGSIGAVRQAWGPIRGLVHAAGVLADKRIGDKTPEQFASVMRTKLQGARALLDACAGDPLEAICFFSSVAAHFGNPGQSDYAAANAALDRIAVDEQARRGAACHVVSIAWGPWDGGMVTPALARHFAARGVSLMPLGAGARAFVDELRSGTHTNVILGCGLDDAEPSPAGAVRFDTASLPMLLDHRIADAVVLPMTVALDALIGAGHRLFGRHCEARHLRLLNGIVFDGDSAAASISVETHGADLATAMLLHASGRPAYRVELGPESADAPPPRLLATASSPVPDVCRQPYASALFHGPAFQVIETVLACSDREISGRLRTARGMSWRGQWHIDPAALDGALQLLRLWGVANGGGVTLPTEIGRCRAWAPWPAAPVVACRVTCRRDDGYRISGDALFADVETGQPLLTLDGIVMHVHTR